MDIKWPTVQYRAQRQQIQNKACVEDPLPEQGGHFHRNFTLFLSRRAQISLLLGLQRQYTQSCEYGLCTSKEI